jgi:hypothetical protein
MHHRWHETWLVPNLLNTCCMSTRHPTSTTTSSNLRKTENRQFALPLLERQDGRSGWSLPKILPAMKRSLAPGAQSFCRSRLETFASEPRPGSKPLVRRSSLRRGSLRSGPISTEKRCSNSGAEHLDFAGAEHVNPTGTQFSGIEIRDGSGVRRSEADPAAPLNPGHTFSAQCSLSV